MSTAPTMAPEIINIPLTPAKLADINENLRSAEWNTKWVWGKLSSDQRVAFIQYLEFCLKTARDLKTADEIAALRSQMAAEPRGTFNVYRGQGVVKDKGPAKPASLEDIMGDLL